MTKQDSRYQLLQIEDQALETETLGLDEEESEDDQGYDDLLQPIPDTWEDMLALMTPPSRSR